MTLSTPSRSTLPTRLHERQLDVLIGVVAVLVIVAAILGCAQ
jgi:hypothetical protein